MAKCLPITIAFAHSILLAAVVSYQRLQQHLTSYSMSGSYAAGRKSSVHERLNIVCSLFIKSAGPVKLAGDYYYLATRYL